MAARSAQPTIVVSSGAVAHLFEFSDMADASQSNKPVSSLLRVCSLLNNHDVRYLVAGGYACILHGLVRTTEDVDILIEESTDNYRRIIDALSELEDHAAKELTPQDFEDNVVIKVADEVEVDISRRAWKISYEEAAPHTRLATIEGVRVPYLSLRDLMASKDTCREQDRADLLRLRQLAAEQPEA